MNNNNNNNNSQQAMTTNGNTLVVVSATKTTTDVSHHDADSSGAADAAEILESVAAEALETSRPLRKRVRRDKTKKDWTTINNTGDDGTTFAAVRRLQDPPTFITTMPGENDILLGRGKPIINYIGNRRFRELVRTRKQEYAATTRAHAKEEIAREILQEISARRGRFLQQITVTNNSTATTGDGENENDDDDKLHDRNKRVYQLVDLNTAIAKIKQTLRDRDYVRSANRGGVKHRWVAQSEGNPQHPSTFTRDDASTTLLLPQGANPDLVQTIQLLDLKRREAEMRTHHMLQEQARINQEIEQFIRQQQQQHGLTASAPDVVGGASPTKNTQQHHRYPNSWPTSSYHTNLSSNETTTHPAVSSSLGQFSPLSFGVNTTTTNNNNKNNNNNNNNSFLPSFTPMIVQPTQGAFFFSQQPPAMLLSEDARLICQQQQQQYLLFPPPVNPNPLVAVLGNPFATVTTTVQPTQQLLQPIVTSLSSAAPQNTNQIGRKNIGRTSPNQ